MEEIQTNSYALKSFRSFDRETIGFYQVEIRARDFGQPSLRRSMTFELNITDVNDERPKFRTNFTFDVIENNRIPLIIGQVTAFDADEDANGRIIYAIVPESKYFFISSNDGTLSTNVSFDYEQQHSHHFQVRARDQGDPFLESFVNVNIEIINVNEFAPQFEKEIYIFTVEENSTSSEKILLGQVKAFDLDDGDQIFYSLLNYEEYFQIDQHGRIWTETIFDREIQDEYRLTVIATDNSTLGSTTVIVHIAYESKIFFSFCFFADENFLFRDINDNPPIFVWPNSDEIVHLLASKSSSDYGQAQFVSEIVIRDDDLANHSDYQLDLIDNELFYLGTNNSLWLKNNSALPGVYQIEFQLRNLQYNQQKLLRIRLEPANSFSRTMSKYFHQLFSNGSFVSIWILITCGFLASCFLLIYFQCFHRSNEQKDFYGSRLIVNDEEKSPQKKTNADYATIVKQNKVSACLYLERIIRCSMVSIYQQRFH